MELNDFIKTSKSMMDQGLQATETALEMFVHAQQTGAERLHEMIGGSMARTEKACMGGLDLGKEGVTTTVSMAQDMTKKMRAGLAAVPPKASK